MSYEDGDPFGDFDATSGDAEPVVEDQQAPPPDDIFGGLDSAPATTDSVIPLGDNTTDYDAGNANGLNAVEDDVFAGVGDDEPEQKEDTFLSVWQARRTKLLEEQAENEQRDKEENEEAAKVEIEEFFNQRRARLETSREENKQKEVTIKEDLNSTFEHGSIWEQVSKMVNLKETKDASGNEVQERMRSLLIHLKNEKTV